MSIRNLLLTLCIPFTAACVTASDGGRDGSTDARGPLGKADNTGSCRVDAENDHCGGPSDGSCWCDAQCVAFGDCCADKLDTCGGDQPGPGPDLCLGDNDCTADQVCDDSKCLSGCPDGGICPAVCFGECVDQDVEEPKLCLSDTACGFGEICDHSECLSGCPDGGICPAVCFGQCVQGETNKFCGDDDDCGEGEFCADACVPSCPVCEDCNNVCLPKDAIDPDPDPEDPQLCLVDNDCSAELSCDHSECHSAPCPEGFVCPAVCFGECA